MNNMKNYEKCKLVGCSKKDLNVCFLQAYQLFFFFYGLLGLFPFFFKNLFIFFIIHAYQLLNQEY